MVVSERKDGSEDTWARPQKAYCSEPHWLESSLFGNGLGDKQPLSNFGMLLASLCTSLVARLWL